MTKIYDRVRAIVPATPNQNRFTLWLSAVLMTVSISANALWIQNAVTTPQTCSQQGTLSFSIMDGTPPYQIHYYGLGVDFWTTSWTSYNSAPGFNSGNYANAAITDVNGATGYTCITVNYECTCNMSVWTSQSNDAGNCNGTVSIFWSGGSDPYNVTVDNVSHGNGYWNGSNWQKDLSGLCAGTHSIIVSGSSNCSGTASFQTNLTGCANVTNGGTICCNQSGNAPYDPQLIYNTVTPSGGSGDIEYLWLAKSESSNWEWETIYQGSNDCYDPASICETTIYRRCSRRVNCTSWIGESNDVTVTVVGFCGPCAGYTGTPNYNSRVNAGLVSLYTFREGAGNTVYDVSGVGTQMNLTINNTSNATWINGAGIHLTGSNFIQSTGNAQKLLDTFSASNAITIEAWIRPSNATQTGPARIVSMSSGTSLRNFSLLQEADNYSARLRTSAGTTTNGMPQLLSPDNKVASAYAQHVVYTMSSAGAERMYVDGILVASGTRSGSFTNWSNMIFGLGNETTMDRTWLGKIYMVALYNQDFDQSEVNQNLQAGYNGFCGIDACDNVSSPGQINGNQSGCPGFNPIAFTSVSQASGGSGTLEYVWITWTAAAGFGSHTVIPNSNSATYDPGTINQDTYFRRCARRNPCTDWVGESNDLLIDVNECCNNTITSVGIYNLSNNTSSNLINGATIHTSALPANWNIDAQVSGTIQSVQFILAGASSNTHIENSAPYRFIGDTSPLNLAAGSYTLTVRAYAAGQAGGSMCDEEIINFTITACSNITNGGQIGANQTGCSPFNPSALTSVSLPSGGSGNIEYVWMTWTASAGIGSWTAIPNSNSSTYDPGNLTESTYFRRCARRSGCSSWAGESNDVLISVTGPCCANVSNGGEIGSNYYGCGSYDPPVFSNITAPTGGTGSLEYQWQYKNASTNNTWTNITSAVSASYNSPAVNTTTQFRRLARRQYCADFVGISNVITVQINTDCGDPEICYINNWSSGDPRIFWLPEFGLDFSSLASDPLRLEKYPNGTAHIVGTIKRNSDASKKLVVNFWFDTKSTFQQWIAMGLAPHSPNQGDEASWTYYKWSSTMASTLTGIEGLAGVALNVGNSLNGPLYGLQIGDGAGSNMPDPNGISAWFNFSGTHTGNGDLNGIVDCAPMAALGNYVWYDNDLDGLQDTNEPGVSNVSATLYTCAGVQVSATTTNANGYYFFPNLNANASYYVVFGNLPPNYVFTAANMGSNESSDSDANNGGQTACVTLGVNEINLDVDAGISTCSTPTLSGAQPSDVSVQCGQSLPTPPALVFTDAIYGNLNAVYTEVFQQDNCAGRYLRTWIATNPCGNSITVDQMVDVIDTTNPALFGVPANATMECGVQVPEAVVHATDNCDTDLVVSLNAQTIANVCGYSMVRIWSVTDDCGNTTSMSQTTTFTDTTDPSLTGLPENQTVVCGLLPVASAFTVSGLDNCDNNVAITSNFSDSGSGCNVVRTITWTATDDCGNSASASRTFTTSDLVDPQLSNLPNDATVACGQLPVAADFSVTASDNCDQNPSLTSSFVDLASGCNVIRTITWKATDDCGNESSASRSFTTNDDIAPALYGVPANATMECGVQVPEAVVYATDNCDTDLVVSLNAQTIANACGYSMVRTWSVTDDCGNTTSMSQTTTFTDTTDPSLTGLPENQTVGCGQLPVASAFTVSGLDNCDNNVAITSNFSDSGSGCNVVRTITWTATDDCGNSASASRTFTTSDLVDPQLSNLPNDATVACGQLPVAADFSVTASDNCDQNPSLTSSFVDLASGCNVVRTITWTATDDCGNESSVSRSFTTNDDIAPALYGVPANATMECGIQVPEAVVHATDNCDTDLVVSLNAQTIANVCGYSMVRTWSVTDDCGNTTSMSQTTTFTDTTDPSLTGLPENQTVVCGLLPVASAFTVSGLDNCDNNVAITSNFSDSGSGCNVVRTITWTATDDCGNSASASRTFTTSDLVDPQLSNLPNDATVACGQLPVAADFSVTASDNCDQNPSLTSSFVDLASGCNVVRTITWKATDDCGNESSASRSFTTNDDIAPALYGVPANATMECGVQVPEAVVYATDNCDTDLVVSLNAQTIANDCGYSMVRTWSVTDDCGNTTSMSQTTTFIDTTDPTASDVPSAITIDCDAALPTTEPVFTDNCVQDVEVFYTLAEPEILGCSEVIARMWRAVDACGNETIVTQLVTKTDLTAPVLHNTPSDVTVLCDAIPVAANVSATDNCGVFVPVMVEAISTGCPYTITRIWTVTDGCGNADTHTQVITVNDDTNPQLIGVPANYQAQCGESPAIANVSATDNCTQNMAVSMEEQILSASCPIEIIRTWSTMDACGNQATASQHILINDTIAPTLIAPADMNAECSSLPIAPTPIATDNCDQDVEVIYEEEILAGTDCQYTIVRTWTATDDCGNQTMDSQTLYVMDNSLPSFPVEPENITVPCDAIPNAPGLIALDNCDSDVQVILNETVSDGCPYVITRTWTATDNCGNQAVISQNITVIDDVDPVLYGVPENMTLQCSDPMPQAVVIAVDNCDANVIVSLEAITTPLTCGFMVTRTWTASDRCGNDVTATQITTFVDNINPSVLIEVPAEVTIECNQTLPQQAPVFADNCDSELQVTFTQDSISINGCNYDLVRTWTVHDDCSNTFSASQTIHVVDSTLPVLSGVPASLTVECNAIPAVSNVTATDNCTSYIEVVFTQAATTGCPYTITRTWTATDACGNVATASQTVTVIDTAEPELIGVPADATVECSNIPAPATVNTTDNCSTQLEVGYSQQINEGDGCSYTIVRSWSTQDACGNQKMATQTLTVVDTTDPVLVGVPANATAECGQIPAVAQVTGTDLCDESVEVTMSETQTTGCPYTITRTWTATDACGNAATASQVITMVDTTSPTFDNAPSSSEVACNQVPEATSVTASDICDTDVLVTYSQQQTTGCPYTITRTWIATDNCNNQSTHVQVLTVLDEEMPVLYGVPSDMELECGLPVPPAVVTAMDNCDQEMIVSLDASTVNHACGSTMTRTWSVTDDCGNTTTDTQVITIVDTTPPALSGVPASLTVACNAIPAVSNVTATDNCTSNVEVVFAQAATSGCPYTITRTWTATDACGNVATASQTVTVIDTVDPVLIGVPVNATVECASIPAPATVNASDNCTEQLEVEYTQQINEGDGCSYTIVRTWSTEDACGNTASASQTLTVSDTTDPVLVGVPANTTAECGQIPAVAQVTGTDLCDESVEVTMSETQTTGCPYAITRTWTATDACGNAATASQVITMVDTTSPTFDNAPSSSEVACNQVPEATSVTASDICDTDVLVTYSQQQTTGCPYTITRTWIATDNCNNQSTHVQVLTVLDEEMPVLYGVPSDMELECGLPVPPAVVTAMDNCDQEMIVSLDASTVNHACGSTMTRTWSVTDDCGNTTTDTQVITIVDTTPPALSGVPASLTVSCNAIPAVSNVTATDNCTSNVEVVFTQSATTGCPYTITRTWTATDACGNVATASQTVTVIDTAEPELIGVPADATVECSNVPTPATVNATDNCSTQLEVGYSQQINEGDGCSYTIVRNWSTQDACGNQKMATQTLTVVDTTDPVLVGVPANATAECGQIPAVAQVTGTDLCDESVEVTMSETQTTGCPYTITRTWTATDACGNAATASQVITVDDTEIPVLSGVPADTTVECDAIPILANVTAYDVCAGELNVFFESTEAPQPCGVLITRTWHATDVCDNTASLSQLIHVIDETDPTAISVPMDTTMECGTIAAIQMPIFTDICDSNLTIEYNEQTLDNGCTYDIVRTWEATDDCGNSTSVSQTIHFTDTTSPILVDVPSNTTVSCDAIPPAPVIVANDHCDQAVEVAYSQTQTTGCPYTITRTWTATDACGNVAEATQIITVEDVTMPVLIGVPASTTMECGSTLMDVPVYATDNCSQTLLVEWSIEEDVHECGKTITRTWSTTDACGNIATASQLIEVVDTTDPVLIGVPANTFVTCDNVPNPAVVSVTDNCDSDLMASLTESVSLGCPYTITRTWTAEDACGNSVSASQVITVSDEVTPLIYNVPAESTMECTGEVPSPSSEVYAIDNCDQNVSILTHEVVIPQSCGYQVKRFYTATDDCGNTATAVEIINVIDETSPVLLNVPGDLSISCDQPVPSISEEVEALDNCDETLDVVYNDVIVMQECGYQIKRFYTATDDCGNVGSAMQMITVLDETAPVFPAIEEELIVNCGEVPAPMELAATDNCDNTLTYGYSETVMSTGCPYQIKRIWTASDDCGNQANAVQMITVIDEVNPTFNEFPVFVEVECDQVANYTITANDNCDEEVTVSIVSEVIFSGSCYGTLQRIYEANDECGNMATAIQLIDIIDNTPPMIHNVPTELFLYCGDALPPVPTNVTGSDNCSEDVTLAYDEFVTGLYCPYDVVRTWTAIDLCGNTTVASQTIHYTVEVAPVVYLNAFPNPGAGGDIRVQFSVPENSYAHVTVIDVSGREVETLFKGMALTDTLYEFGLEQESYAAGSYTLRVVVGDMVYSQRMMVLDSGTR
jgi:large repetitive protein